MNGNKTPASATGLVLKTAFPQCHGDSQMKRTLQDIACRKDGIHILTALKITPDDSSHVISKSTGLFQHYLLCHEVSLTRSCL